MSAFTRCCRAARDEREPLGRRRMALRRAVERYASLTRTRFTSVVDELRARHGLAPEGLAAAADALEAARTAFLAALAEVAAARRARRRAGGSLPAGAPPLAAPTAPLGIPLPRPTLRPAVYPVAAAPPDAPPPALPLGARVRVRPDARGRTPRRGAVVARVWHHALRRWMYFIEANGRRVSGRYFRDELDADEPPTA